MGIDILVFKSHLIFVDETSNPPGLCVITHSTDYYQLLTLESWLIPRTEAAKSWSTDRQTSTNVLLTQNCHHDQKHRDLIDQSG